ncbi:MAG: YceI family protein [Bacteroidetes bacterium]|nr:YceI family protein [Bacteroidota bacterium]MBS1929637.1 YceI family protein [Bacteroidota bacterium]
MKKTGFILSIVCLLISFIAGAQGKYYTKSGKISLYSSTSMENINASNKTAVAVLDSKTGELQFAVLLKGFEFKKALMQEHFNSDYVESDKFPKSEFKGQIINNNEVNYTKDGNYRVNVKGRLTLHGETKDVETTGSISVKEGKLHANSVFNILLADYNISIPWDVRNSISKTIQITVDCGLEPLQQ